MKVTQTSPDGRVIDVTDFHKKTPEREVRAIKDRLKRVEGCLIDMGTDPSLPENYRRKIEGVMIYV